MTSFSFGPKSLISFTNWLLGEGRGPPTTAAITLLIGKEIDAVIGLGLSFPFARDQPQLSPFGLLFQLIIAAVVQVSKLV